MKLLIIIFFLYSCTKYEVPRPTCFRYYELDSLYTGEWIYIRTDTIFPSGQYNSIVCGEDTMKLKRIDTTGCIANGWEVTCYKLIR